MVLPRSEATVEAALDRMLEYSEAREAETNESVAVAAMFESWELSDDASADSG